MGGGRCGGESPNASEPREDPKLQGGSVQSELGCVPSLVCLSAGPGWGASLCLERRDTGRGHPAGCPVGSLPCLVDRGGG